MKVYIRNCYTSPTRLFVRGGGELKSSKGKTQGDPIAMAAYSVGVTPLFPLIKNQLKANKTKHVAFADEVIGAERLRQLREWWNNITIYGPPIGYYPKPSKSWLAVKERDMPEEA